ncbi:MAG: hypothetical protein RI973_2179 [Bacteroidota bacterium]|jgi:predicted unusual protein kinase regulating ubiquinone biosynthesis (AarF/ABC1/UbiB family)
MSKDNTYQPAWRMRKAYSVASRVIFSYLWLWLLRRLFGRGYYEKRIIALHIRNAERIKNAILELKGLFIKVGQLLSVSGSFLPEEFQRPLEQLQDRIPPRPYAEVQRRLVQEFGELPETLFRDFEQQPIAAASIGQAHRATLPDGTTVVVKVQHANIEEIARVDLAVIRRLTLVTAWFFDIRGLDYVYSQIRKMIEEELDFLQEAAAMQRIAENLKDEPRFVIPQVYAPYSSQRVLTTAWQDGVKVTDLAQLEAWKIDRRELATRLIRVYCRMVFKDGYYHADPHPGNILVKSDGTLVLLDFGAVATLSREMQEGIPRLIEAAIRNDVPAMVAAAKSMGFISEGREAEAMAGKMIAALREFLQNEIELEGLRLVDVKVNPLNSSLFDLLREIGLSGMSRTMQVPRDWVLLNRMITLLLGLSTTLDPMMNPLQVVRPYVREYVARDRQDMVGYVTGLLRRTVTTSLGLPEELHRVLLKIDQNQLETRTPDIRQGAQLLYQVGQQFVLTLIVIAAATFGYLFYTKGAWAGVRWGFGFAGFFVLLLLRSLHKGSRIRQRLE